MYESFRLQLIDYFHQASDKNPNKLGLRHQTVLHPHRGPDGENLFTDYIYSPEKKSKVLIHISGVHGIEGYIGSLIQQQILQSLSDSLISDFQLILVHAVNPYGMAWFHRTNSQNIDLNRNSLTNYHIENPYFRLFDPLLTEAGFFKRTGNLLKSVPHFLRLGKHETIKAVASGQTEFPQSLFFAGHEKQFELASLQKKIIELTEHQSEFYILDVHSGLGRLGQEMLIIDSRVQPLTKSRLQTNLSPLFDVAEERDSYPAIGSLPCLFHQIKDSEKIFHVFQEFGTRPLWKILQALSKQSHFVKTQDKLVRDRQLPELKDIMLNCFFPHEEQWRKTCTAKGVQRFTELAKFLKA